DDSRFVFFRSVVAALQDRRKDGDAFLTLPNEAAHCSPRVETRYSSRGRPLRHDQADIVQTVTMESRHRFQQRGKAFAATLLEQGSELLQRFGRALLEIVGVHNVSSL